MFVMLILFELIKILQTGHRKLNYWWPIWTKTLVISLQDHLIWDFSWYVDNPKQIGQKYEQCIGSGEKAPECIVLDT